MTAVAVVILHPEAGPGAGPLAGALTAARATLAARHHAGFSAAGADRVEVLAGPPDGRTYGSRLRTIVRSLADLGPSAGLIVLGSGAGPLLSAADRRAFVAAAATGTAALANNRYSADIVAIPRATRILSAVPDLATDNALPRWLAASGLPVADRRTSWRLGVDLDSPLDLVLLGGPWRDALPPDTTTRLDAALATIRAVATDPRAELLVAGRTSAAVVAWLERSTVARTRALVEERGLRTSLSGQRPPASSLGLLLERDGPGSLAAHLVRLGDGALLDTRVLLAHRLGPDEATWPSPEDRFASDLLLPERIADPWLRELTATALAAPIPVVLGGHTLVGPGVRLALRAGRR